MFEMVETDLSMQLRVKFPTNSQWKTAWHSWKHTASRTPANLVHFILTSNQSKSSWQRTNQNQAGKSTTNFHGDALIELL